MIIHIVLFVIASLALLKLYNKFSTGKNNSYTCLIGKTAIVTGANTGIGFITALDFAKRGARVILACRNLKAGEEARDNIVNQTNNNNVVVKHLDFKSLKSVQNFANDIVKTNEKIHILVNNAGAGALGKHVTEDNMEILMQVNYFGSFLLTCLLLDTLKRSAPSRIVNVSSIAAKSAKVNVAEINSFPPGNISLAEIELYKKSKLCNILFTIKLAEKLHGTHVTANALHPGFVDTDIFRRVPTLLKATIKFLSSNFFKNAEEGAQTSIYVAVSKEVEGVSGCYFSDCKKIDLYKNVNKKLADDLWLKTTELLAERGFST